MMASFAGAQAYPDKSIRFVVPVPAGGGPDVLARLVSPAMAKLLGQQIVIDNRGGAAGLIGVEMVAKSAPDGYTLLFSSSGPSTILPHLHKDLTFDAISDFAAVGQVAISPQILVAHPSLPVKNLKELIALARKQPGKLTYASAGPGSANHLTTEMFKSMAGINILHVPYKGQPQALTDVLGGFVDMTFNAIPQVLPHVKTGRLRLLGISSAKRSALLPDLPTIAEGGVPDFEAGNWYGLLAPAKTPRAVIARLNETMVKVVHDPELVRQFATQGADPVGSSPDEFSAFVRREYEKFGKVVKVAGLKVE